MNYNFIPLEKRDTDGVLYTIGHAIIWNPYSIRMDFIISHEALRRDTVSTTIAPYYVRMGLAERVEPYPALSVREAIAKFPDGLAYFNAGESGMLLNPLIEDGMLLTKPQNARAVWQKEWEPLNDTFSFFLQHIDGCVELQSLRIVNNQIHPDDLRHVRQGTYGFSVPYILKNGKQIRLKNPLAGETSKANETWYTLGAPAALCAIGLTPTGHAVWVGLIGDVANPADWGRNGTEDDLVQYLRDFGVTDALFAGASGDVQYYDAKSKTLAVAAERAKSEDKRWVLREGQTERGVSLIVKLVNSQSK
ncbi:MAG: hypothetical protein HZB51_24210 [Chloroflexi bacterium]|nr:hypothetical protein [Chloroflexota bacterium]